MYEKSIIYRKEIEKEDIGEGKILQMLGEGKNLNTLHWDLPDGSIVDWHEHPQEQFGYVIKGGFRIFLGDEEYILGEGDAYYIPADTQHKFVAVGETEAIDVFNPLRKDIPGRK